MIRIANAQGFWGDSLEAPFEQLCGWLDRFAPLTRREISYMQGSRCVRFRSFADAAAMRTALTQLAPTRFEIGAIYAEKTARVRIDDQQKTVAKGALWYEESLPTESILAGLVWCDRVFGSKGNGQSDVTESSLLNEFCPCNTEGSTLQIGGKATVGKGRVRCTFTASNAKGGKP